jgi:signal transduction histidine kinase
MESRENRTESVMINGAVIKAFRSKQCEAEADMPFQQCFQIAVRLIDIIRNGDCNVNEKGIKELMALLRQIIWLSLPVFQSQDRAMNSSLEIMLGVFLIILGAEGCWLEYMAGGENTVLEKGNCRLRKEFWSRGSDCLVYETIDGADIWGIICIESPANTLDAQQYIELFVRHCLFVFNLHSLLSTLADSGMILSAIESAVMLVDRSMELCYANRDALNILELDGTGCEDYHMSDIEAPWNGSLLNNHKKPGRGIKSEYNGRYLNWSVYPLVSEETVRGWLIIADDCTEYYEFQKYGAEAELIANNSMTLSSLAHEIKTPLNILRGLLQMIMTEKDSSKVDKYLERCVREIDRADSLMDNILQMKRLSGMYSEAVDIGLFLDDIMPILNGSILNKSIKLITHKEMVRKVNADPEQLTQVVVNIIKNAVEAIDGEGEIYITVREASQEWVELSIRDNGAGISPDIEKSLFEPFVTTKERGTGLGLAICRAIVRKNRGELSALNHPEGGALFSILLPCEDYDRDKTQSLDILLVSCDDMVRSCAEQSLSSEGFSVFSAGTVDSALFVLDIYSFSLIILDGSILTLGDYDAFREACPEIIKIVLISDGSRKEYTNAHYIRKPLDCRMLNEKVRYLIGGGI